MFHPWHDIELGDQFPHAFPAVIEIPRGDTTKYEMDLEHGYLKVDRVLHPKIPYPANYGFVPGTLDEDGDPVDILVVMQTSVVPLSVLRVRPVGVVEMVDEGERDNKIIAVHLDDIAYKAYKNASDLPPDITTDLKWFFNEYKEKMQKEVNVESFQDAEKAKESLIRCQRLYLEKFSSSRP
jgi:inorganic pyrophosphatase